MQNQVQFVQPSRVPARPHRDGATRIAIDEYELATRWGLSVKTLRRWRQEQLGPIFCKLGSRVTYLIPEVEAFERRVSRHSTFARAYWIRRTFGWPGMVTRRARLLFTDTGLVSGESWGNAAFVSQLR